LWICLSRLWRDWHSALAIVKPETVLAWHRAGFRLFWTWKVRQGQPGRSVISREVRDLIHKMCRENPTWGAPRIHGELLKLGINIAESSVSKYMLRCHKPPSQSWSTFLENHAQQLVSIDFITVPKVRTVVPGNDGRSKQFLMQIVKEGIQKGEFHSSLGPEAAVDAIVAMVRGLSVTYVRSRRHGTSSSPIPYVAGSKIVETAHLSAKLSFLELLW